MMKKIVLMMLVGCNGLIHINARPMVDDKVDDQRNEASPRASLDVERGRGGSDISPTKSGVPKKHSHHKRKSKETIAEPSVHPTNMGDAKAVANSPEQHPESGTISYSAASHSIEAGLDTVEGAAGADQGRPSSSEYQSPAQAPILNDSASNDQSSQNAGETAFVQISSEPMPPHIDTRVLRRSLEKEFNESNLSNQDGVGTQQTRTIVLSSFPSVINPNDDSLCEKCQPDPKLYEKSKKPSRAIIIVLTVGGLCIAAVIAGKFIVKKVIAWRDKLADAESDDDDEKSDRASLLEAMGG